MNENEERMKVCKKCRKEIDFYVKKCPYCHANQKMPIWAIALLGIIIIFITIGIFGNDDTNNKRTNYSNGNNNSTTNSNINQGKTENPDQSQNSTKKVYGFNEAFVFDNLEITIGSNYAFEVVQNHFSEYNNQSAIKLPITVKNLSNDTHGLNMFEYDVYGSKGTEAQDLGAYFDENIDHAGDLRSGASYTKFLYFLYDGDGKYAIEFDNYSTKITVEFEIRSN